MSSRRSNWGYLVGVILSREPANFLGCGIQRSHGVRGRRISLNNERFDYFGEGTLLARLHYVTQPDAVTINKKPDSDFRNPIGMLCDCHRRIERFLAGLIAIARGARGGSIPEANRALFESGLRYFREAAPKHTLDEEESLFPRLLKYPDPQTKDALAVLDHLEAEHIKAADRHIIVDRLGREWLAQGSLSSVDADLLIANLQKLHSDYEAHISFEDDKLFPLAARLLGHDELNVIGEEMAARRGLSIAVEINESGPG